MTRHGIAGLDFHWRSDPFSRLRTGYLAIRQAGCVNVAGVFACGFASAFCVELSSGCLEPRGMQPLAVRDWHSSALSGTEITL